MTAGLNNDKSQPDEQAFSPGNLVFGKFQVISRLGAGNMGSVYKVREINLDKLMALKVLHSHAREQKYLLRFQNEARIASKLIHRSVARVYDFGLFDNGVPYLAIEFIEGRTLESILAEKRRLDWEEFLSIFIDVAEALDCAHRSGIVHRDVKPGNIIVCHSDGVTKVVDFGLAKSVDDTIDGAQSLTLKGQIMGTPLYMSPEQSVGESASAQSDLYSLGCVMYESLSGQRPIGGLTAVETLINHRDKKPAPLRELVDADVPDAIIDMIETLLEKQPGNRLASALEVSEILQEFVESDDSFSASAVDDMNPKASLPKKFEVNPNDKHALVFSLVVLLIVACGIAFVVVSSLANQTFPSVQSSGGLSGFNPEGPSSSAQGGSERFPGTSADMKISMLKEAIASRDKFINLQAFGPIDVEGVRLLRSHEQLENLNATDQDLSDAAFEGFGALPNLKVLTLKNTHVSNLKWLACAPALTSLNLEGTRVNDEAMSVLAAIPTLESINISRTPVTARGLERLAALPSLTSLEVEVGERKPIKIKDLVAFVERHPDKPYYVSQEFMRAVALLSHKRFEEKKYAEALVIAEREVKLLRSAGTSKGSIITGLMYCANYAHAVGKTALADKYYSEAIELAHDAGDFRLMRNALRAQLVNLFLAREYTRAEQSLETCLRLLDMHKSCDNDKAECIYVLASLFGDTGLSEKAMRWWHRLFELKVLTDLTRARALAGFANSQRLLHEESKAAENFEKAMGLFPAATAGGEGIGDFALALHRSAANEWVLKHYDRALHLNQWALKTASHAANDHPVELRKQCLLQRMEFFRSLNRTKEFAQVKTLYDQTKKEDLR